MFTDFPRWVSCLAALSASIAAPRAVAEAALDFEKDVRPILEEHCFDCHDETEQKNKLRLDTTIGLLRGGESGEPLIVHGKSAESYLIKRVISTDKKGRMPPKGDRLTEAEVKMLRAWIDGGAKMPGAEQAAAALELKTDHWSFKPVKRPAVPKSGDSAVRGEIDEFVVEKLREKSLQLSPPTDRSTLIRRLYLVMHGMPPASQEVADFLNDQAADAYERLVDRVLASPRYGERWARHWMDVVRYADSNGFETNRERKTAYHYRDYLIAALNADKPYDRFVKEQIAGDALGEDAATGFLVAGPYDIVKSPDIVLTLMQRQDELADMVNTTGTAFLGLTMGCARCHNHKFDPVPQKDYYAMQAVFAGVNHGERPIRKQLTAEQKRELDGLEAQQTAVLAKIESYRQQAVGAGKAARPAVNMRMNEEKFAAVETSSVKLTILAATGAEPCVDELEIFDEAGVNVALGAKPSASGTLAGFAIHQLAHINDGKHGNDWSWISNTAGKGWVQLDFPATKRITRIVWGRDRNGRFNDRLATEYRFEAKTGPEQWTTIASSDDREPTDGKSDPAAFVKKLPATDAEAAKRLLDESAALKKQIARLNGSENGWLGTFSQPGITHRLYRGEPMQKREVVPPGALTVLAPIGLTNETPEQQRRLALAEWIASPRNPLTARVFVNRLWHYIFGVGLVDTPSDFGANGGRPSHPELLDWLADEFVQSGWSIKHMQRLILTSAAFQQSSAPRTDAAALDAGGRLLWRYTPRRLEAEAIRDSALAVSGALDLKMGGPGFYLMDVVEENVMHYYPKEKYSPAEFRRMVYQFRIRQTTDSVFGSFDCPDGGSVMPKRSRSNTPLQALNLFNSSFVIEQAALLAKRLQAEAGEVPESQVDLAFRLFYARSPDEFERSRSAAMIREHGVVSFARALFNTSEFLFIL